MAKGIYERKGLNGDVTYYIRYQVDGTDIKEAGGQEVPGIYPRDGQGCSQGEAWGDRPGSVQSGKGAQACALFEAGGTLPGVCRRLQAGMEN